jgi:phospholipase C
MYRRIAVLFFVGGCFEPAEVETEAAAWETTSVSQESSSTHLWIVDRAVDQLGRQSSSNAVAAYRLMTKSTCKKQWQQGLYDADYKAPYHGGWSDLKPGASEVTIALSGATWAPHFYDPSTGANYQGDTTTTAKTQALAFATSAKQKLAAGDTAGGCYALGLALHFFTDITQPMHATNFTATDSPVKLHSNVEVYSMGVQTRYAISSTSTLTVGTPTAEVDAAAWTSHDQWPGLYGAIDAVYTRRCVSISLFPADMTSCWQGDAAVDAQIGISLRSAQIETAEFILALDLAR